MCLNSLDLRTLHEGLKIFAYLMCALILGHFCSIWNILHRYLKCSLMPSVDIWKSDMLKTSMQKVHLLT
jgi:hypothetical protein